MRISDWSSDVCSSDLHFAHEAYRLEQSLTAGDRLAIVQDGEVLAEWPLELVPDTPPEIEFESAPSRTERAALPLNYHARADYGLAQVKEVVPRPARPEADPLAAGTPRPGGGAETRNRKKRG